MRMVAVIGLVLSLVVLAYSYSTNVKQDDQVQMDSEVTSPQIAGDESNSS